MIDINDLFELKARAEKYGGDGHSFVCHPDNCDLIFEHAEDIKEMSGKDVENPKMGLHLFGMPVIVLPLCPKDKIYVLSRDMVDRMSKMLRETL